MPLNIPNYGTYAFSGLLAWTWFQISLVQATGAITTHRELIRRPGFPAAILPAIPVTTNLINLLLALPLLLIFILLSGSHLSFAMLGLPFVMGLQFILILSLAYLLATANVLFRDTQHIVGFLLQILLWLTPVFYLGSRVPGKYQTLYRLNPMLHIVEAYHDLLIYHRAPDYRALIILSVAAITTLFGSYSLFVRMRDRLVEEL
jgi:lipopolysaccharide transport system permease protein